MREWFAVGLGLALGGTTVAAAGGERHKRDAVEPAIQLAGDNLEQTVHCHGNAVHVQGNGSRLTIEGNCATVFVEGNRNFLEVQDADVIDTKGTMNSVLFLNPGTRTVDHGRANDVSLKYQQ